MTLLFSALTAVALLCAVFFLLSTLASHLLEMYAGLRNLRGELLETALRQALSPEARDAFFRDAAIATLAHTPPSWLARLSARAAGATATEKGRPSYLDPELIASTLAKLHAAGRTSGDPLLVSLNELATQEKTTHKEQILKWFEQSKDRQNGVYTRWSTWRLIVIGFALAALLDIDAVAIGKHALTDPQGASRMIDAMQQAYPALTTGDLSQVSPEDAQKALKSLGSAARDAKAEPQGYGWGQVPPVFSLEGAYKFLGWIIAAVAVSFGAQFWFNLMGAALKLRAAGPNPEENRASSKSKETK